MLVYIPRPQDLALQIKLAKGHLAQFNKVAIAMKLFNKGGA